MTTLKIQKFVLAFLTIMIGLGTLMFSIILFGGEPEPTSQALTTLELGLYYLN